MTIYDLQLKLDKLDHALDTFKDLLAEFASKEAKKFTKSQSTGTVESNKKNGK